MMQRFFIFVQAATGKASELGVAIAKSRISYIKDISSISGKWDLLLRVEIDGRRDVSQDVISQLFRFPNIVKTKTVVAYAVYDPADYTLEDDFD
ncbi:AsnC family transcriptional regulator [Sphingomonas sp. Root710]|uniref:AsnC family transcriptional regulator n=1 Tax=Sphingomonas sp. Root710 TaxID=1736594 RepID=UPI0006F2B2B8|nr:AsnC family transcriptional regulator [Sphingomonas sp. Root710]KRB82924.1 AsnC family transcriptional regulator [Sphingomonas sp. Root710]